MKYKEFKKAISNSYIKERQAIYENLKQILDLPDDDPATAERKSAATAAAKQARKQAAKPAEKPARHRRIKNFFKQPARLAACVSAAVAVVCVAIMLPFTLNSGSGLQATTPSTSDNPSISEDRFCVAASCKEIELKYSLKEYSQLNKLSLLYVDWYAVADIKTSMHVNDEDSTDIVYYEEVLKHKFTGSIAELYITNLRTHVDKLDDYKKAGKNVYNAYTAKYSRVQVFWGVEKLVYGKPYKYEAWFKYGNYIYVLVLRYPTDENSIFELIDSMLHL